MAERQYDAAVAALREAVERDRENTQYQVQLVEAEAASAEEHLAQADQYVAENRLSDAHVQVKLALDRMPGHPRAISMNADLERQLAEGAGGVPVLADAGSVIVRPDSGEIGAASIAPRLGPEPLPADAVQGWRRSETAQTSSGGEIVDSQTAVVAATGAVGPREVRPQPVQAEQVRSESSAPQSAPAAEAPAPPQATVLAENVPSETVPPAPTHSPQATRAKGQRTPEDRSQGVTTEPPSLRVSLSRDDDHLPKQVTIHDGIFLKLKDTSSDPPMADVEIRVGKYSNRYKRLRVGSRLMGRGESRRSYQIVVLGIDPRMETVYLAVDPLPMPSTR